MTFSIIDGRSPTTIHYSIQFKALFGVDVNHTYNTSSNELVLYVCVVQVNNKKIGTYIHFHKTKQDTITKINVNKHGRPSIPIAL
jgi:hypothetical protein